MQLIAGSPYFGLTAKTMFRRWSTAVHVVSKVLITGVLTKHNVNGNGRGRKETGTGTGGDGS